MPECSIQRALTALTRKLRMWFKRPAGPTNRRRQSKNIVSSCLVESMGSVVRDSGLRISVHRTGGVTLINTSGATVTSSIVGGVETPDVPNAVTRKVAEQQLDALVQKANPSSTIHSLGLTYRLPDHSPGDLVKPMQTYSVSADATSPDGRPIHGRISYSFYSIEDASIPPLVWPIPETAPKGDPR
jgi:hypothetical protein